MVFIFVYGFDILPGVVVGLFCFSVLIICLLVECVCVVDCCFAFGCCCLVTCFIYVGNSDDFFVFLCFVYTYY